SAFLVNNVLIPETHLSLIFFITGLVSIFTGPILGRASDSLGKYRLFVFGTLLSMVMVFVYTNLGPNPVWVVILINTILWIGISSRMISSSALTSGVGHAGPWRLHGDKLRHPAGFRRHRFFRRRSHSPSAGQV